VGASASIFGLLGALYHYGQKSGRHLVRAQVGQWALIMFVYGLIVPNVDNAAHAGGFIGGYLLSALFNPLKPERGDHLLIGGLCLLASMGAILYSVIRGLALITS
jgi:rhomboid protease GluP